MVLTQLINILYKVKPTLFVDIIKNLGIFKYKFIPDIYKYNSRDVRLHVLAGFIDTDGSLNKNGTSYSFSQSIKHEKLYDDIVEIARSLGFVATKKIMKNKDKDNSFIGNIYGDVSDIPVKIKRKKIVNSKTCERHYLKFDLKKCNKIYDLSLIESLVILPFTIYIDLVAYFIKVLS